MRVPSFACWLTLASAAGIPGASSLAWAQGPALSIRGGDVSSLPKAEDKGGRWRDGKGEVRDALSILQGAGVNTIRLKVWLEPADGYNDKARVVALAKRVKALGMKLLVDFHYSDAWADPGKQVKPRSWRGLTLERLRKAVYDHTFDVLSALKAQGTPADLVQIGNEINDGMLWEEGRASKSWPGLAQLLNAGADAAKAVSPATQVVMHLADGGKNDLYRWWFDAARTHQVRYDVIGLSYYPIWHGDLAALRANLNDVAARYGKPVLVVETGYPFTTADADGHANLVSTREPLAGYPATPAGQASLLRAVMAAVRAVPSGRGLGVVYWEPTWTAVPGAGWDPADAKSGNAYENQALFDYEGRALPALQVLGAP
ncbi:MAG: arabinogalactan endo-1,4-beta-galactosidase [Polyangiales bacterium]